MFIVMNNSYRSPTENSILSRAFARGKYKFTRALKYPSEYVPETASEIIITVGTLHNNHRNLREFSLQLRSRTIHRLTAVLRRFTFICPFCCLQLFPPKDLWLGTLFA